MARVALEKVNLWADPNGSIHITFHDPQRRDSRIIDIPKGIAAYWQLADFLTRQGETVPGWPQTAGD